MRGACALPGLPPHLPLHLMRDGSIWLSINVTHTASQLRLVVSYTRTTQRVGYTAVCWAYSVLDIQQCVGHTAVCWAHVSVGQMAVSWAHIMLGTHHCVGHMAVCWAHRVLGTY